MTRRRLAMPPPGARDAPGSGPGPAADAAPPAEGPSAGLPQGLPWGLPGGLARRSVLAALLPLAGCGFQPVYMPTAAGNPGVAERELAAVDVAIIADRPGQLLRQSLQKRMASDGGGRKRYDLRVSYWISGEGVSVLTDNAATRLRLTGYANWVLVAADPSQARLTEGSARAVDAVNVLNNQFFALDMQNDVVQQRIADQVAEQIATQLAIWFRQRTG